VAQARRGFHRNHSAQDRLAPREQHDSVPAEKENGFLKAQRRGHHVRLPDDKRRRFQLRARRASAALWVRPPFKPCVRIC
jgi:hypothetical protein